MGPPDHGVELGDATHRVTARWEGGVTVVLRNREGRILARGPVGEPATRREVEAALRDLLERYLANRRRSRDLVERARLALQQSWTARGVTWHVLGRSRALAEESNRRRAASRPGQAERSA